MTVMDASSAISTLVFGGVLAAVIVALTIVDLRHMILPDALNLTLAATGLVHSCVLGNPGPVDAALGALAGVGVLVAVAFLFRRLRGIDGLGRGDQKFIAAAGVWIGWQGLAATLLIASLSALVFVAARALHTRKFDPVARLPFGPFLGLGTFVTWFVVAMETHYGGG